MQSLRSPLEILDKPGTDISDPDNIERLYRQRLARTRKAMVRAEIPILLVLDPVNIRYATGASNMPVFSLRTPARYLLLFAEGPAILYEYFGCHHLAENLPTIDEVRDAHGLCFSSSGGNVKNGARVFAEEIADTVKEVLGSENRMAIDRFPYTAVDALREKGFAVSDADAVFYDARKIKLNAEIQCMQEAMRRVEAATSEFEAILAPGMTESEAWGIFHGKFIESEGLYISTRLMQSGEKTYPYFQECGSRKLNKGDLVCLDTDAVGYMGYAVDFSRTFLCGDNRASAQQTRLYSTAMDQLEHNTALFAPGKTIEEIARHAWRVPDEYRQNGYYCIAHGLGMSGEYPNIMPARKGVPYALHGMIEPGMVICVESYIGSCRTGEGVKLEEQLLITDSGITQMSQYPFEDRLLS